MRVQISTGQLAGHRTGLCMVWRTFNNKHRSNTLNVRQILANIFLRQTQCFSSPVVQVKPCTNYLAGPGCAAYIHTGCSLIYQVCLDKVSKYSVLQ